MSFTRKGISQCHKHTRSMRDINTVLARTGEDTTNVSHQFISAVVLRDHDHGLGVADIENPFYKKLLFDFIYNTVTTNVHSLKMKNKIVFLLADMEI